MQTRFSKLINATVPGKRSQIAHFSQNLVIATVAKSRLCATKCAIYLVMKVKCCGVIAISVRSFLSTANRLKFEKTLIEVSLPVFTLFYVNPITYSVFEI